MIFLNIGEIIGDSLRYPLNNVQALLIYIVLGIIIGIIGAFTGATSMFAVSATGLKLNVLNAGSILGSFVMLLLSFLIIGYQLDIVNYGIELRYDAPGLDFVRQIINGIKLLIVNVVYFLIPTIVCVILGLVFQHWIVFIVGFILFVLFALLAVIGSCRLANTDSLAYALNVKAAYVDASDIGFGKLIGTIVIVAIIALILSFIVSGFHVLNAFLGGIIGGIINVYIVFFIARATGLLYYNVG